MKILAIPSSCGLRRPVSGGQAAFVERLTMHIEKGNSVCVLEADSYRDEDDLTVTNVSYFREMRFAGRDLVVFRDFNPFFCRCLVQAFAKIRPDVVEFNSPSGLLLAKVLGAFLRQRPIFVYQAHNVEADFMRDVMSGTSRHGRVVSALLPTYINVVETVAIRLGADHVTTLSIKDKQQFDKKYRLPGQMVTAVPLGRKPTPAPASEFKTKLRQEFAFRDDSIVAVFVGSSMHEPNVEAVEAIRKVIAPSTLKVDRTILFVIAGAGFTPFNERNVRCLGYVPELQKLLSAADIGIAPLARGGGVKIKILDYMAAGLPVVATSKAAEGFEATNGIQAILVEAIDARFSDAILDLAHDRAKRLSMGVQARKLAQVAHNWEKASDELESLYRRIQGGALADGPGGAMG